MQSNDPNLQHLPQNLQGQNLQGQALQGQNLQGQVLQGQTLPGQVLQGQTHVHHDHGLQGHLHQHHHQHGQQLTAEQQALVGQTGVGHQGMTLVSTEVGQTVVVNQGTLSGGQVYTSLPGATTTTTHTHHTHTHGTGLVGTGVATGVGTGVATGAGLGHGTLGHDYKGTFVFRPLEGRFTKDKDIVGKMDPYVKIKIGWHSGKSSVAKSEGTNPVWGDVIPLEKKHHEEFAKLKVKDKDRASLNDKVGETKIPLADIAARGRVNQWFPVYKKEVQTGEILLDIAFEPLNRVV